MKITNLNLGAITTGRNIIAMNNTLPTLKNIFSMYNVIMPSLCIKIRCIFHINIKNLKL